MAYDHSHNQHNGSHRSLFLSFLLIASFMVVEAVGGWFTNSLALLSDAGHMLTDACALALSLLALKIGAKPPSPTQTFGYRRFEILAALLNGLALWAIVGVILHEAYTRLQDPPQVKATGMIVVAAIGLVVNLISIRLLHAHKDDNINVRGAFLHVMADSLGSVGALIAGLVIRYTDLRLIDPLVSLVICLLILWSSWGIVRDAVHILLLGVPSHIDYREVEAEILSHSGVCCVYDLHIWSIASGHEAISAHVVVADGYGSTNELLSRIVDALFDRFGVDHATLQMEESHTIKENKVGGLCRVESSLVGCENRWTANNYSPAPKSR
ncbi:MAG: cation diffusion facilitator family transporter [Proteobacteria bacterium]|nr:cation diffusion facilitator family transporter [Pseudomonadota bacterium]MBU1688737.1 cation diffusion facilitator family transporter [Pseudomonadota bacterium]